VTNATASACLFFNQISFFLSRIRERLPNLVEMKRFFTLLICSCAAFFFLVFSSSPLKAQQTFKTTTETVIGLLEYVPADYNSNSNKYPLVIFLHGVGERGANSTDPNTLKSTINLVAKLGPPKHVADGYKFPFILISPQLKNNYSSFPLWYIMEVLEWAKKNHRVDEKRIHITGLSMGGGGTFAAIEDYPQIFASAAPVCPGYNTPSKACKIAGENIPVWSFHGDADTTVPLSKTSNMINAINGCSPTPNPKAKLTVYPGVKHDAWGRAYAPNNSYHTPNVYEWMMQQVNTKNNGNSIPTANAGADKSYSGVSSITLTGSGSDSDGSIASYSWTKMSGPAATFSNASAANTSVAVTNGTYIFRLTVKDNSGNTDSDYVKIVVSSATSNAAPKANAGADVTVTLPTNSVTLTGSGSDTDGSISSYTWTKVSGGSATLANANTSKVTISGLVEGTYVFRLTVKDNGGATGYDDVTVFVKKSVGPTVNAGADMTLFPPTNYTTLKGTTTGTIASYSWTKVSGGNVTMTNATTPNLSVSNLEFGKTYFFRLTVKDTNGKTASDDVMITVRAQTTETALTVNAGSDMTLFPPINYTTLKATTTGNISSYSWTKVSGGNVTMTNATTPNLTVSNLDFGKTYFFRLTVKDTNGKTASDDVMITVRAQTNPSPAPVEPPKNQVPTVNGGPDITLISPASTARLYGQASDPDGSIVSYTWTKVSGGVANLSQANTKDLVAWGLVEGTYVFRLTVKDNGGATAYDDVKVVVTKNTSSSSPSGNKPPVVNAGADVTLILPATTARLYGKVTDPENNSMTYQWTKVSGPAANLSQDKTTDLVAWKLVAGTYIFRLTATDQYGASSYDDVKVTVK
jgi:Predicted peptidase